jgi:ABC-type antimicrobial peptide transport system permease subunit
VASLFAAFLGYNPVKQLLGTQLHQLPAAQAAALTGRSFFPRLISGPFSDALGIAFTFAVIACVVAAIASALRGGKYHYRDAGAASAQDSPPPGDVIAR